MYLVSLSFETLAAITSVGSIYSLVNKRPEPHTMSTTSTDQSPDEKVIVVDFEGDHPQDWPATRKWTIMATIAVPLFLMPLSSTITTPTVTAIADEFLINSSVTGPLALSLFLLMYSMGPILLGPFSEMYGRWPVLQAGSLFYLAFNIGAGLCTSMTQLLIFRLLSGVGASASLAVSFNSYCSSFFSHI